MSWYKISLNLLMLLSNLRMLESNNKEEINHNNKDQDNKNKWYKINHKIVDYNLLCRPNPILLDHLILHKTNLSKYKRDPL